MEVARPVLRRRRRSNASPLRDQLPHTFGAMSARFDEPSLASVGGLVPVLESADRAGLRRLAEEHLTVPTDKGACRVERGRAGRGDGDRDGQQRGYGPAAPRRDGPAVHRHLHPSTLGSFLRSFAFGHVRQSAQPGPGINKTHQQLASVHPKALHQACSS